MLMFDDVVSVLEGVKRKGRTVTARCPAHNDKNPSFNVRDNGGKALYHCHAGCQQDEVTAAIKARLRFRQKPRREEGLFDGIYPKRPKHVVTECIAFSMEEHVFPWESRLDASATALRFLKDRGITLEVAHRLHFGVREDQTFRGRDCVSGCRACEPQPALVIPTIWKGKVVGVRYRALLPHNRDHKWSMAKGSTTKILQYADLDSAHRRNAVIVTEGPLDAATLMSQ